MLSYSCAFTGHRPARYIFGYDEEHEKCRQLKALLAVQIAALIDIGVTTFYTGMSLGADQWAAEIVLGMKAARDDIRLIAVIPCETQADRWSVDQRDRYFDIVDRCDDAINLQTKYTPTCMMERNRWLVDHAEFLLAVYDGGVRGGTAYTVKYAEGLERKVTVIHPYTLEVVTPADIEALRRRGEFRLVTGNEE